MPLDREGLPLRVGDLILVPARVCAIDPTAHQGTNIRAETTTLLPGADHPVTFTVNGSQVARASSAEEVTQGAALFA